MAFPTSNLPTGAVPWGREVEKQINTVTATVKSNEVNNAARDNQLSASLVRVQAAQARADAAFAATGIVAGDVTALETDVNTLETNVYYPGTTTINGGNIRTGTVGATQISASYVYAGTVSASQITTGTLNASLITVNNLSASSINTGTLNASLITVNNLSASSINTGTLNASLVTVTNLSANSITTGTLSGDRITGGTITGTTLETASSGRRVKISGTTAIFYDESSLYTGTITVTGSGNGSVMTVNGPFTSRSISFSSINTYISGGGGTYIDMSDEPRIVIGGVTTVTGNFTVSGSSGLNSGWQNSAGSQIGGGTITSSANGNPASFSRIGTNGTIMAFSRSDGSTSSIVGSISVTTAATAYNTSSDYRLKENVVPLTGALDRLNLLKPSKFNFIVEPDRVVDGFIAHEVAEVIPEAIHGEKDAMNEDGTPNYQGIDQSKIVPLLVAAVQELAQKVTILEGN